MSIILHWKRRHSSWYDVGIWKKSLWVKLAFVASRILRHAYIASLMRGIKNWLKLINIILHTFIGICWTLFQCYRYGLYLIWLSVSLLQTSTIGHLSFLKVTGADLNFPFLFINLYFCFLDSYIIYTNTEIFMALLLCTSQLVLLQPPSA